jgi:threonine aldolase
VYFVFGGTAANVGLKMITESYHGIICAESAHINVDECARLKNLRMQIILLPSPEGKIG